MPEHRSGGPECFRASTLQAWRGSLVSQHKLVLQEYVATPQGEHLVRAAAAAAGATPQALQQLITRLPELDFYVPQRSDRRSWKATADVAIFATLAEDAAQAHGYTTQGEELLLKAGEDLPRPIVLLHPAEVKALRMNPQSPAPGPVIEDADDGTSAALITWVTARGDTVTRHLAELQGRFVPEMPSLDLRPTSPALDLIPGTGSYIATFRPYFHDGIGLQNCEIRYTLDYYQNGDRYGRNGYKVTGASWTDTEVPCSDSAVIETDYRTSATPNGRYMIGYEPRSLSIYDYLKLTIVELDSFVNDKYRSWCSPPCFHRRNFG